MDTSLPPTCPQIVSVGKFYIRRCRHTTNRGNREESGSQIASPASRGAPGLACLLISLTKLSICRAENDIAYSVVHQGAETPRSGYARRTRRCEWEVREEREGEIRSKWLTRVAGSSLFPSFAPVAAIIVVSNCPTANATREYLADAPPRGRVKSTRAPQGGWRMAERKDRQCEENGVVQKIDARSVKKKKKSMNKIK